MEKANLRHSHSQHHGCHPRGRAAHLLGLFAMGGRGYGEGFGRGFGRDFAEGFSGGGGPRGGPRGRRRMFDSGELRLVLLKLLADEPRHGYDLIRAIEELTGGDYAPSPGTVYPTLTLLEDMGLIAPVEAEGARKAFTATDAGRAQLDEKADEVAALIARLEDHGERRSRADRAPVRRAMHGLHSALWGSVSGGEFSDEQVHAIADILDEATRKIERLG